MLSNKKELTLDDLRNNNQNGYISNNKLSKINNSADKPNSSNY